MPFYQTAALPKCQQLGVGGTYNAEQAMLQGEYYSVAVPTYTPAGSPRLCGMTLLLCGAHVVAHSVNNTKP